MFFSRCFYVLFVLVISMVFAGPLLAVDDPVLFAPGMQLEYDSNLDVNAKDCEIIVNLLPAHNMSKPIKVTYYFTNASGKLIDPVFIVTSNGTPVIRFRISEHLNPFLNRLGMDSILVSAKIEFEEPWNNPDNQYIYESLWGMVKHLTQDPSETMLSTSAELLQPIRQSRLVGPGQTTTADLYSPYIRPLDEVVLFNPGNTSLTYELKGFGTVPPFSGTTLDSGTIGPKETYQYTHGISGEETAVKISFSGYDVFPMGIVIHHYPGGSSSSERLQNPLEIKAISQGSEKALYSFWGRDWYMGEGDWNKTQINLFNSGDTAKTLVYDIYDDQGNRLEGHPGLEIQPHQTRTIVITYIFMKMNHYVLEGKGTVVFTTSDHDMSAICATTMLEGVKANGTNTSWCSFNPQPAVKKSPLIMPYFNTKEESGFQNWSRLYFYNPDNYTIIVNEQPQAIDMETMGYLHFFEGDRRTGMSWRSDFFFGEQEVINPLDLCYIQDSEPTLPLAEEDMKSTAFNYIFEEPATTVLVSAKAIVFDYGQKGYETRSWEKDNKRAVTSFRIYHYHYDDCSSYHDVESSTVTDGKLFGDVVYWNDSENSWRSLLVENSVPDYVHRDLNDLLTVQVSHQHATTPDTYVTVITFSGIPYPVAARYIAIYLPFGMQLYKTEPHTAETVRLVDIIPFVNKESLGFWWASVKNRRTAELLSPGSDFISPFTIRNLQYTHTNWLANDDMNPVSLSGYHRQVLDIFDTSLLTLNAPVPSELHGIPRIVHMVNEYNPDPDENSPLHYQLYRDKELCQEGMASLIMGQGTLIGFSIVCQEDCCYGVPLANSPYDFRYKYDTACRLPIVNADSQVIVENGPWQYYARNISPINDGTTAEQAIKPILTTYTGNPRYDFATRFNFGSNHIVPDFINTAVGAPYGYSFLGFTQIGMPFYDISLDEAFARFQGRTWYIEAPVREEIRYLFKDFISQTFPDGSPIQIDKNHIHVSGTSGGGNGSHNLSIIDDQAFGGSVLPPGWEIASICPRNGQSGIRESLAIHMNYVWYDPREISRFQYYGNPGWPGGRNPSLRFLSDIIDVFGGLPTTLSHIQDCPPLKSRDYNKLIHFPGQGIPIETVFPFRRIAGLGPEVVNPEQIEERDHYFSRNNKLVDYSPKTVFVADKNDLCFGIDFGTNRLREYSLLAMVLVTDMPTDDTHVAYLNANYGIRSYDYPLYRYQRPLTDDLTGGEWTVIDADDVTMRFVNREGFLAVEVFLPDLPSSRSYIIRVLSPWIIPDTVDEATLSALRIGEIIPVSVHPDGFEQRDIKTKTAANEPDDYLFSPADYCQFYGYFPYRDSNGIIHDLNCENTLFTDLEDDGVCIPLKNEMFDRFSALSQADSFVQKVSSRNRTPKSPIPSLIIWNTIDYCTWLMGSAFVDVLHDRHQPYNGVNGYVTTGIIDNYHLVGPSHGWGITGFELDVLDFFEFTGKSDEDEWIYFIESFTDPADPDSTDPNQRDHACNCGGWQSFKNTCTYVSSVEGEIRDNYWSTTGTIRLNNPVNPEDPDGALIAPLNGSGTVYSKGIDLVGCESIQSLELFPIAHAGGTTGEGGTITIFVTEYNPLLSMPDQNWGAPRITIGEGARGTRTTIDNVSGWSKFCYKIEMGIVGMGTDRPKIDDIYEDTFVFALAFKYLGNYGTLSPPGFKKSYGFVARDDVSGGSPSQIYQMDVVSHAVTSETSGPAQTGDYKQITKMASDPVTSPYFAMSIFEVNDGKDSASLRVNYFHPESEGGDVLGSKRFFYTADPTGQGSLYLKPPADISFGFWRDYDSLEGTYGDYYPCVLGGHASNAPRKAKYRFTRIGTVFDTVVSDDETWGSSRIEWGGIDSYQWQDSYYAGNLFTDLDGQRFAGFTITPHQIAHDSVNGQYVISDALLNRIYVYDYDDRKAQIFDLSAPLRGESSLYGEITTAEEQGDGVVSVGPMDAPLVLWVEKNNGQSSSLNGAGASQLIFRWDAQNTVVTQTTAGHTITAARAVPLNETQVLVVWLEEQGIHSSLYCRVYDQVTKFSTPPGQDSLDLPAGTSGLSISGITVERSTDESKSVLLSIIYDHSQPGNGLSTDQYIDLVQVTIDENLKTAISDSLTGMSSSASLSQMPGQSWFNTPLPEEAYLPAGCQSFFSYNGLSAVKTPGKMQGKTNLKAAALTTTDDGTGFGAYASMLSCGQGVQQRDYLQIAVRPFTAGPGTGLNVLTTGPQLAYRGEKPYIGSSGRSRYTVDMAARDAENYIVVWERWTDSTYSVGNATKPGQKIEAFFVMDNVPYQNMDINESAEGGSFTLACAPQVTRFRDWYYLTWLDYDETAQRCSLKMKKYTYLGQPITRSNNGAPVTEETLDIIDWTGSADDLWLSVAESDSGSIYLSYPYEETETGDVDIRTTLLDGRGEGQFGLAIAPAVDYDPNSGHYTSPQIVITNPGTDEVYIADVNQPGVDWTTTTPTTLPILATLDLTTLGTGLFNARYVDATLVYTDPDFVSRAFVVLTGDDSFVAVDVDGSSSAFVPDSYESNYLVEGSIPTQLDIESTGEYFHVLCPGNSRVRYVSTIAPFAVGAIEDQSGQEAVISNPIDVTLPEIRRDDYYYYNDLYRYVYGLPMKVFTNGNSDRITILDSLLALSDPGGPYSDDESSATAIPSTIELVMERRNIVIGLFSSNTSRFLNEYYQRIDADLYRLIDLYCEFDESNAERNAHVVQTIIRHIPLSLFAEQGDALDAADEVYGHCQSQAFEEALDDLKIVEDLVRESCNELHIYRVLLYSIGETRSILEGLL